MGALSAGRTRTSRRARLELPPLVPAREDLAAVADDEARDDAREHRLEAGRSHAERDEQLVQQALRRGGEGSASRARAGSRRVEAQRR